MVDTRGNLTLVTGTYLLQETNTYTTDPKTGAQSGPVACFNSGTFKTDQKLSSSSGGGGGTLTVTNALPSVGGTFVPDVTQTDPARATVFWSEFVSPHFENIFVQLNGTTDKIQFVSFNVGNLDSTAFTGWTCFNGPSNQPLCSGVTVNRAAGTLRLENTVLDNVNLGGPGNSTITLNGTLTFTPF